MIAEIGVVRLLDFSFLSLALGAGEAEGAEGDPGTVSVFICDSHWQYTG